MQHGPVRGEGSQVAIITLWTRKEHILKHLAATQYAIASQLYSRDEGISQLLRGLLREPTIRDVVLIGTDLNRCADTLIALWEHGVRDGRVINAPGYVDRELPEDAIDRVRTAVTLHDLRTEKHYETLGAYLAGIPKKPAWGPPETYPEARIIPPARFPNTHATAIRHDRIDHASIELAHLLTRFGTLTNVHVHLTDRGRVPEAVAHEEDTYTEHVLDDIPGAYGSHLHRHARLATLVDALTRADHAVITFGDDVEQPHLSLIEGIRTGDALHLAAHARVTTLTEFPLLASALFTLVDTIAAELHTASGTVTISIGILRSCPLAEILREYPHVLRKSGDPRSNILIRVHDGRITVTHLSPDGKRLESFTGETAKELYTRLVVEHRITDLSHAAYLGYELGRAEHAARHGGTYVQDG